MTHVSFNSYASKIFENHPLVVWGLDDNLHYLSAFGNQESVGYDRRMFYTWNTKDCIVSPIVGNYPDGLSHEFNVTGRMIPNASQTSCNIVLGGVATWSDYGTNPYYLWSDLDDDFATWREALEEAPSIQILQDASRKSICVSFFVGFGDAVKLIFDSIDITINYQNISNGLSNSQTVNVPIIKSFENWRKILGTFDMTDVSEGFLLSIKFNFASAVIGNEEIWLAGFNIGYWSEVFCHEYNGVTPIAIPQELENIIGEYLCAPLASVFDDTNNGWVIVEDAKLLAMHDGLPLVYGSINQTCLYYPSTPGLPSIVLPSNGFLTQSGKYNDSTFEFWMRIDNKSQTPFKIFGTFNSTDGLYVENGFFTLKVGSKYASHYVGKWYRPMLVSIRYSPTKISLLINGEQVLSFTIDDSDVDLLSSDEYLAFFCDQNTFPFEIDCIAIYPYYQSIEIAKKNFVYGQMVQKTNITDQSYKGDTVHFDFTFSKYDVDFKIPDSIKWNTGIFTNVFVNDSSISVPSYSLPEVIIKTVDEEPGTSESDWSTALASSLPSNSTYIHFNYFIQLINT